MEFADVEGAPTALERKLLAADGVRTAVDLVERCDAQVAKILGADGARVAALRAAAGAHLVPVSARALLARGDRHVASGFGPFDAALGGGCRRGALTELVGRAGAGKTQVCHMLCAACAARGHASVYVDAEHTFRPERVREMCGGDAGALERVYKMGVGGCGELLAALERGDVLAKVRATGARLCVLDSVAALARGDFVGRADLIERQRWLARAASALKRIAYEADVAVVVTNHVMADFTSGDDAFDAVTPALGLTWYHAVTTRVVLDAAPDRGRRFATVAKAPDRPSGVEVDYAIGPAGLVDAAAGAADAAPV